jgi:hypothetical protein
LVNPVQQAGEHGLQVWQVWVADGAGVHTCSRGAGYTLTYST